MRDFSLHSGERQIGATLEQIRRDHVARYEKAIESLKNQKNLFIADCFCGNGYGTNYISEKLNNSKVLGLDASKEAIEFANEHYGNENVFFSNKYFPFKLPEEIFDVVISFESIEHVSDGIGMFNMMVSALKPGGIIWFSVPNENVNSLKINKHKFHLKHYTHKEIMDTFSKGLQLEHMYGQDVYVFRDGLQAELLNENTDMELKKNYEGQVLIYCFRKPSRNLFRRLFD